MGRPKWSEGHHGDPWLGRSSLSSSQHCSLFGIWTHTQEDDDTSSISASCQSSCHHYEGSFILSVCSKGQRQSTHICFHQLQKCERFLLCRYGLQLALNLAWTPLFFGKRDPGAALVDITGAFLAHSFSFPAGCLQALEVPGARVLAHTICTALQLCQARLRLQTRVTV